MGQPFDKVIEQPLLDCFKDERDNRQSSDYRNALVGGPETEKNECTRGGVTTSDCVTVQLHVRMRIAQLLPAHFWI